jgi:hypothetical protein
MLFYIKDFLFGNEMKTYLNSINTHSVVFPWITLECTQVNVILPRYENVKLLILKYYSPLQLKSGVKF